MAVTECPEWHMQVRRGEPGAQIIEAKQDCSALLCRATPPKRHARTLYCAHRLQCMLSSLRKNVCCAHGVLAVRADTYDVARWQPG